MFKSNIKTQKTSNELKTQSNSILSIFTNTIEKLNKVISDAKESISIKEEEIKSAEIEKSALENIVIENETIVTKIESILK